MPCVQDRSCTLHLPWSITSYLSTQNFNNCSILLNPSATLYSLLWLLHPEHQGISSKTAKRVAYL